LVITLQKTDYWCIFDPITDSSNRVFLLL